MSIGGRSASKQFRVRGDKRGYRIIAMLVGLMMTGGGFAAELDVDALFADAGKAPGKSGGSGIKGYVQFEAARTTADPDHWSKLRARGELSSQGNLGGGLKYKLSARADYDFVYDINDFYPQTVRHDQRSNFELRENYLDVNAGDWDLRLGRQHVVWGEMVGLFFADVVSARNLKEFILPDFEPMRIPQWAARAEYFKDDFHAELLWIPVASYDQIGKPGAEFYPPSPVPGTVYRQEKTPSRSLDNMNYGIRLSKLTDGLDISAFYYNSMDIQQTFYRIGGPTQVFPFIIKAQHDHIEQLEGTFAKDFGSLILKGEAVYTDGRRFTVLRISDADGLAASDTLDWALGADFTLPAETRFNVQVFQRVYFSHDRDMINDRRENGYSLYLSSKLTDALEGQALLIASLNRTDWLFRPKLSWNFQRNWRLLLGADIFHGPRLGFFGQYDQKDRVYTELRYSF